MIFKIIRYKDNVKVEPSPSSNPMILGDSLFFLHVSGGRKGDHHHNGDTGTYYCLARNEVGKAISRNATLEIACKYIHYYYSSSFFFHL